MRERIGYHCLVDVKWSGGMEKGGINFLLFCFDPIVYFSIKELSILITLSTKTLKLSGFTLLPHFPSIHRFPL